MINLTNASLKIYLALQPCDMRKSFNGLTEIATEHLGQELVKEAIFAFVNKRRNRLKLLYFDGTGLWVAPSASKKAPSAGPPATTPATKNSNSPAGSATSPRWRRSQGSFHARMYQVE